MLILRITICRKFSQLPFLYSSSSMKFHHTEFSWHAPSLLALRVDGIIFDLIKYMYGVELAPGHPMDKDAVCIRKGAAIIIWRDMIVMNEASRVSVPWEYWIHPNKQGNSNSAPIFIEIAKLNSNAPKIGRLSAARQKMEPIKKNSTNESLKSYRYSSCIPWFDRIKKPIIWTRCGSEPKYFWARDRIMYRQPD